MTEQATVSRTSGLLAEEGYGARLAPMGTRHRQEYAGVNSPGRPGPTPSRTAPRNFKAAFCECFGCPAEAFQETLFWRCLAPHARPLGWLVRVISPDFFQDDLAYLGAIGEATSLPRFRMLANGIRENLALNHGLLRKGLRLRISGARLFKTCQKITERDCQPFPG